MKRLNETSDLGDLRRALETERELIRNRFFDRLVARRMLASYSHTIDRIIEHLFFKYLCKKDIEVVAIGGYGRRELYPASDIDLLLVYEQEVSQGRAVISTALHILWDLGINVSQQVWSWSELETLSPDHDEFIFALLDARPLFGKGPRMSSYLSGFFPGFLREHRVSLMGRLAEWTRHRHAPFRATIYQLEPDLKQSPGGLRDYQVGLWASRMHPRSRFRAFSEEEADKAHDFLATLRILLHYLTGRNQNHLTHRLQEQISRHLGYRRAAQRSAVESLMKTYFLHARVIFDSCMAALGDLERNEEETIEASGGTRVADLEEGLDLCASLLEAQRPLGDDLSARFVEILPEASKTISFPSLRKTLLRLFEPRPGLYPMLSRLYQLGILELLFPEFSSIRARVIRDFYHKYTVDEHSLQAIRAIEELRDPASRADARFATLLEETGQPAIVTLTLLLHDVGKSRGGKHVVTGARMAAKALRRFRFDKAMVDMVVFLVANHLAMSSIIFRRNLEDDEVVGRFSDLVGTVEHLRLLCLVTYGDMKGVAPDTLNEWKRDRLWQLYVATYNKLTLGYGDEKIEEEDISDRLLSHLPSDLDLPGFESFLEGFPLRYLNTTPPEEIYGHYRLGRSFSPDQSAQVRITSRRTHYELCVVTRDTLHLFSRIVGLLSYFDMNILRGYGFTNRQNLILDFFQFADTRDVFRLNPDEKQRFQELLLEVVEDKIPVDQLMRSKEESVVFQSATPDFPPRISFDQELSSECSIMEIVAPDSTGLLYRISREISAVGCNIELVLISTEGDRAVDVFYLTEQGSKLGPVSREGLSRRITRAIGKKYEADHGNCSTQ